MCCCLQTLISTSNQRKVITKQTRLYTPPLCQHSPPSTPFHYSTTTTSPLLIPPPLRCLVFYSSRGTRVKGAGIGFPGLLLKGVMIPIWGLNAPFLLNLLPLENIENDYLLSLSSAPLQGSLL